MIWMIGKCKECPMFWSDEAGHCGASFVGGGERNRLVPEEMAAAGRPEWCPLEPAGMVVKEAGSAEEVSCENCSDVLVYECAACPFFFETNKPRCNVANPRARPIMTDDPRPFWCALRKEGVIMRRRAK
jgi:hypothetical protein